MTRHITEGGKGGSGQTANRNQDELFSLYLLLILHIFFFTALAKGKGNRKLFDVVVFFLQDIAFIMKLRFVTVCYCQLDFLYHSLYGEEAFASIRRRLIDW